MVDHSLWKMAAQLEIAFLVPNVRKSCHVARDGLWVIVKILCVPARLKQLEAAIPSTLLLSPFASKNRALEDGQAMTQQ